MGTTEKADIFTVAQYGDIQTFTKKFYSVHDINQKHNGSSLLHYSIAGRRFDIAQFLLDHDIDVDMPNSDGQTPLHLIGTCQSLQVAEFLLQKGATPNIRDKYGNNALWTAVFNCKGKNYEMVELFMKYHPDVTTKNKAGRSPLDFASQVGDEKLICILQER